MTRAWMILALGLAACSSKPPEKPKDEVVQARVVGRVASVAAEGGYVLIQILGPWEVPDDQLLQVRSGDGRVASLRPTGERQGRYAAADIVAGTPQPGDAVLLIPTQHEPQPPAGGTNTPATGTQPPATNPPAAGPASSESPS